MTRECAPGEALVMQIVALAGRRDSLRMDGVSSRRRRRSRPFRLAVVVLLLWLVGPGCAMLCPRSSPEARTRCGAVRLDYPACRRLRVVRHDVLRDNAGRLVVRTEWENELQKPYEVQIRVSFFDAEGRKEKGSGLWDRQSFQPGGGQLIEWTSYTPDAARYLIEVKSASAWPF